MKVLLRSVLLTMLCSNMALLSACMTPGKNVIPVGGAMTMPQIYAQETGMRLTGQYRHSEDQVNNARHQVMQPGIQPYDQGYTQPSQQHLQHLFHVLPNPQVPLHIYPHYVQSHGESYPKPGTDTEFFLYKQNHFALPNEHYGGAA